MSHILLALVVSPRNVYVPCQNTTSDTIVLPAIRHMAFQRISRDQFPDVHTFVSTYAETIKFHTTLDNGQQKHVAFLEMFPHLSNWQP